MAKWTQIWGQAHAALSFFSFTKGNRTYRLVMRAPFGGEKIRLRLSNAGSDNQVVIGGVTAGLCDEEGNLTGDTAYLSGKILLNKGGYYTTDGAPLKVKEGDFVAVNIFVIRGRLNSGNLLNNARLIIMEGDKRYEKEAQGTQRGNDTARKKAGQILKMSLHTPIPLFDSVEILSGEDTSSIVVFGDSLSQQGFWVNPFSERIYKTYPGRYSVINKSIMGNRVLRDCSVIFPARNLYGPKGVERYLVDVLSFDNVSHVVFFIGINDIIQFASINGLPSEKPGVDELVTAMLSIISNIRRHGIKVMVMNLINFRDCVDATDEKAKMGERVNALLKENAGLFDGFYDVNALLADEERPYCTRPEYLGGDKLHLNSLGGQEVADNFDLSFFE